MSTAETHEILRDFEKDYPSEQDCLKELFRLAQISDKACRFCNNKLLEKRNGDRAGKCSSCKRTTWFTAGTWLHHMKNARARLAAIYLAERGNYLSSSAFAKAFEISQSSAFMILKWLSLVIENLMPENVSSIHSSNFVPVFCKRSRETPAGSHPASEQDRAEELENKTQDSHRSEITSEVNMSNKNSFGKKIETQLPWNLSDSPTASAVMSLLSEVPISFDALSQKTQVSAAELSCTLTLLELEGLTVRTAGDRYIKTIKTKSVQNLSETDLSLIPLFFEFVKNTFHGISRKYLQKYLALYWCRLTSRLRTAGEFMKCCLQTAPNLREINSATPIEVRIPYKWNQHSESNFSSPENCSDKYF